MISRAAGTSDSVCFMKVSAGSISDRIALTVGLGAGQGELVAEKIACLAHSKVKVSEVTVDMSRIKLA